MKLVIEISEKDYNDIMTDLPRNLNHYERLIANGTPLPKGHGRWSRKMGMTIRMIAVVSMNVPSTRSSRLKKIRTTQ